MQGRGNVIVTAQARMPAKGWSTVRLDRRGCTSPLVHRAQDDKNASRGRRTGGRVRGVPPMSMYKRARATWDRSGRSERRRRSLGRCRCVYARREGTVTSVGYLPSNAILRDLDVITKCVESFRGLVGSARGHKGVTRGSQVPSSLECLSKLFPSVSQGRPSLERSFRGNSKVESSLECGTQCI
jgi:hypothetical protein